MNKLGMIAMFGAGSLIGAVSGTAIGVPLVVRALQAEEVKAKKFVILNDDDVPMGHIDAGGFSFDGPEGKEAFFFRNTDRPYISFRRQESTAVTLGCIGNNDGLVTYHKDSPRLMMLSAKNYSHALFTMFDKPLDLDDLENPEFVENPFAFISTTPETADITISDKDGQKAFLKPPTSIKK